MELQNGIKITDHAGFLDTIYSHTLAAKVLRC